VHVSPRAGRQHAAAAVVAGLVAAALYGVAAALWPRRRQPSPRWQPLL